MNYMAEVAKMLGVELGEEFESRGYTYKLTEDGLVCSEYPHYYEEDYANMLRMFLTGEYSIKRKHWKPNDKERYWYVDKQGRIGYAYFDCNSCTPHCTNYYKLGNCYRTREEAEANRDKWVVFYASDEILEV